MIANRLAVDMPLVDANIDTLTSRFGVSPLAIVPVGSRGTDPRSLPTARWAIEAAKKLVSP